MNQFKMPLYTYKYYLNLINGVGKELHRTNVKRHKENEERELELEKEYQIHFQKKIYYTKIIEQ